MASIAASEAAHVVLLRRGRITPVTGSHGRPPADQRPAAGRQAIAAMQAALAAKQAAARVRRRRLAPDRRKVTAAAADCVAHSGWPRDALTAMIAARRAPAAAAAYRLPVPVSSSKQAMALAIMLERQVRRPPTWD